MLIIHVLYGYYQTEALHFLVGLVEKLIECGVAGKLVPLRGTHKAMDKLTPEDIRDAAQLFLMKERRTVLTLTGKGDES